ncbi:MAG: hypothetical protein IJ644_03335, partial [Oscillospiraceae bacterium]|nr:hypothetical protein [Oscillospiraceae bacterium]
ESIFLSDRIIIMQPNPGRIYKDIKVPFARPRIRENLTDTEEYRNFRKEIVLSFYDAEQEANHDSQKAISENHTSIIRSFTADSVSPLANGG